MKKRRPATNLFDWAFGPHVRELVAQEEALKLASGEFKLKATVKGWAFTTTRNRQDRLVHAGDLSYVVWRRTRSGAIPQRLVARAFCGQWITQAQRADWFGDVTRCERCYDSLVRSLKEPDEDASA